MEEFKSGAKRSERKPRYDLIPKVALDRLANRFTGELIHGIPQYPGDPVANQSKPTGGALKYGECNWEKGLPTSDVINHIYDHLTSYVNIFRENLKTWKGDMNLVVKGMKHHSVSEDDLAAAMWGLVVLMHQEDSNRMYHDDKYTIFYNQNEAEQPAKNIINSDYIKELENKIEFLIKENFKLSERLNDYESRRTTRKKNQSNRGLKRTKR